MVKTDAGLDRQFQFFDYNATITVSELAHSGSSSLSSIRRYCHRKNLIVPSNPHFAVSVLSYFRHVPGFHFLIQPMRAKFKKSESGRPQQQGAVGDSSPHSVNTDPTGTILRSRNQRDIGDAILQWHTLPTPNIWGLPQNLLYRVSMQPRLSSHDRDPTTN